MRISDWSSDVCSSDLLGKLQVLQDSQIRAVQQKLAQAGVRSKDLAVAVIFGPIVLPILFGGLALCLKIGRAACRERVCTFVKSSVVAGSVKKNIVKPTR